MGKIHSLRGTCLALAGTSLLAFTTPAFAQDAQSADEADSGEIIVTARRRNESLQDTPVALTAINAAMIEDKNAVNIGDLTGAAPN
eukprot:gene35836-58847_t